MNIGYPLGGRGRWFESNLLHMRGSSSGVERENVDIRHHVRTSTALAVVG